MLPARSGATKNRPQLGIRRRTDISAVSFGKVIQAEDVFGQATSRAASKSAP